MTTLAIDLEGMYLEQWVAAIGQRLRQLPREPAPVLLAHALSGFLAVGRVGLLLDTAATDPDERRNHALVYEITAAAEMWLTDAAGEMVTAKYTDRGDELHVFLTDPEPTSVARRRLRQTAHATATATLELLNTVSADISVPRPLRDLARDLAAGADIIATLYGDDSRKQHLVRDVAGGAREQLGP